MELKQAILQIEKQSVEEFLKTFDLCFRYDTTYTVYMEEKGEIIGTVSLQDNVITMLAVYKKYQGENVAVTLVNHVISKLREEGVYGYKVFTKPEYLPLFINMGFCELIKTDSFCALEGGQSNIEQAVENLKTKVIMELGSIEPDTGAIVINGNPFTKGHLALCEYALQRHRRLLVFVLQEDISEFSFKERFSLAFLALRAYSERVSVLPSTEYIVSKSTFPSYFLHGVDAQTKAYAQYDALIFKKYFMEKLGISKRYLGSETTEYMQIYNNAVANVLGDGAEVVDRFTLNEKAISAKEFRTLVKNGNLAQALELIPTSTKAVMNFILQGKKW